MSRLSEGCWTRVLLATAAGDAVGLPREGLSPRRAARLFGDGQVRHRLLFGRGLCSDDTEHAAMTAQALLASRGDVDRFARSLAWRLRWWLLGCPAGIGWATLRSIVKLWVGFPPGRSGVWSAGNGPCMRAAAIGLFAADDDHLRALVRASTRLTHADPRAEAGAVAVAVAARYGARVGPAGVTRAGFLAAVEPFLADGDLRSALRRSTPSWPPAGVSGYVNQTVPAAIDAWLADPGDVRAAVTSVVLLGGDTDTTAAIVGALAGATGGVPPSDWVDGIVEWPRSTRWLRRLADGLAVGGRPVPLFWPGLILRNAVFAVVVVTHGVRRLLRPW